MGKLTMIGVCATMALGLSKAEAQTIRYEYNGTTTNVASGQDIVINVGAVTGTQLLQLYDPALVSGLPDDDVGKVTIRGSVQEGSELRILMAGAGDFWPENFTVALSVAGLRNFGLNANDGLVFEDAMGQPNPDLAKRSRLAAFTSQDIRGEIVVGQVQRIQCGVDPVNPTPGTVSADITATALNGSFFEGEFSIGYIRAGNGITGTITAEGDASVADVIDFGSLANIGRIVVGPSVSPAPLGIQGPIFAKFGRIGSIFTTGPIGTSSSVVNIHGGDGIAEVRAINETGTALAAADFHVNVLANSLMLDPVTLEPLTSFTVQDPDLDGVLNTLETAGNLYGEVRAANLGCGLFGPGDCSHIGIFVQGVVCAPIRIDYFVWFGNIVGRTFLAPITIGRFMKGSVVAVGGAEAPDPACGTFIDGHIHSISLGRGALSQGDGIARVYANSGPGLCGITGPAFTPSSLDDWFTQNGVDSGAIDGVIKAASSIGIADIASVALRFDSGCKPNAPRVEAPVIDQLVIDDLRSGGVWSGLLEQPANNPANDYALVGTVDVGCIGVDAALWMHDWLTADFENVFGNLHIPSLPANRTIRIARHLADAFAPIHVTGEFAGARCECIQWPAGLCPLEGECLNQTTDSTPLDPRYPQCATAFDVYRGRIWVRDQLAGQIIINADNGPHTPTADYMTGGVQIGVDSGSADCPAIIIADDSDEPDVAPYYARKATGPGGINVLGGGGAIGLAPFHMHEEDCDPPHDPNGTDDGMAEDHINDMRQVRATFYGPIRKNIAWQSWAQHVRIHCRPFDSGDCTWFDVSSAFDVIGPTSTTTGINRRSIRLQPKPDIHISPGVYRLFPFSNDSIKCEDVTGNPAVVWPTACVYDTSGEEPQFVELPSYVFVISGDCDGDNILDQFDGDLGTCFGCEIGDFNDSGSITVQDIFDFLTAYFSNDPDADVNQSGTISVQDFFDFLSAFFAGCP